MRRMFSKKQIEAMVQENPQLVVEALKGQDINVEGITSKGIANTGNIGNTGDIAATGKITGGEIVENMSGYSFELPASPQLTPAYVGVVKNGNKITMVISGVINRGESTGTFASIGDFIIPSDIYSKIIPLPSFNSIDNKIVIAYKTNYTTKSLPCVMTKETGNKLRLGAYGTNQLDENTDYAFRYECTFLLSENLISEE